jgi:serine/threonine-protein kinase RsbW
MSAPVNIQLNVPATHQYLNVVGACIEALLSRCEGIADPESAKYNVQLAVQEVCANIVDHAYADQSGRINIAFDYADGVLTTTLSDQGCPFDPSIVPTPDLDNPQEHGLGLFLVHQLMDQVTYTPSSSGNVWQLHKQLKD